MNTKKFKAYNTKKKPTQEKNKRFKPPFIQAFRV